MHGRNPSGKQLLTPMEKEIAAVDGAGVAGLLLSVAVSAAVVNSTPWS